jgi:hypothetical protein
MFRRSHVLVLVSLLSGAALTAAGCMGDIDRGAGGARTAPNAGPGGPGPSGAPGGGEPVLPPGAAAPPSSSTCPVDRLGPAPLHRLTRMEYDNTIRELIGEDLKLSKEFVFDEKAGEFAANFFTPLTEVQFAQYATAAEAVAEKAAANLARVVPCDAAADAAGCGDRFVRQFGRQAFRRPLEPAEVTRYGQLFEQGRSGLDFANGVRLVVQAMLQSPKFLYLIEGPGPLTQHQLAARLAYFLWNAPPDAQLAAAADAGGLGTRAELQKQARRLLTDRRGVDMIIDFHNQWLGYWAWEMGKDAKVYPEFEALQPALLEETNRFVADAIASDGGRLETLLTSTSTFVNAPLAAVYGVPAPPAGQWAKVNLDPKTRSGLLTQASFLSAHGAYDGSSPIRRGLAVRERILCAEMPVPPPGADSTFPEAVPTQTTRQRFDRHRTDPSCASCHALMDKIGYGFESYDGIGRYRTTENGAPVDDSGEMTSTDIDGPFKGAPELARRLLGSQQVHECVTSEWFRYAFGRLEGEADRCTLQALSKIASPGNLNVVDLVTAIVESDAFLAYRPVQ